MASVWGDRLVAWGYRHNTTERVDKVDKVKGKKIQKRKQEMRRK
jgi:hypothetical protein